MISRKWFLTAFCMVMCCLPIGSSGQEVSSDEAMSMFLESDYGRLLAIEDTDRFDILLLQARAARESGAAFFIEQDLSGRGERPDEVKTLQAHYDTMTDRLERALGAATTESQRVAALTLWLATIEVLWTRALDVESDVLLAAWSDRLAYRQADDRQALIEQQGRTLSQLASGLLLQLPEDERERAAGVVLEAYREMYSTPVEEERFLRLVRDLPFLITVYSDAMQKRGVGRFEDMIRWHLWLATSQLLPSEAERAVIESQEAGFARLVHELTLRIQGDEGVAQRESEAWLDFFRLVSDNVFWPYGKVVENQAQREKSRAYARKMVPETLEVHLQPALSRVEETKGKDQDALAELQDMRRMVLQIGRFLLSVARLNHFDPSSTAFLPNHYKVMGSGHTQWRDTFMLIYTIDDLKPIEMLSPAVGQADNTQP